MDTPAKCPEYHQFVQMHQQQLKASQIPEFFWRALHRKIVEEYFQTDDLFELLHVDYDDDEKERAETGETTTMAEMRRYPASLIRVMKDNVFSVNNPNAIYLIDHAWTFRPMDRNGRLQLHECDKHLKRLCSMLGIECNDDETFSPARRRLLVEKVLRKRWQYCQAYHLNLKVIAEDINGKRGEGDDVDDDDDPYVPFWYLMDEVGSAIKHTEDEPNCRIVPFIYRSTTMVYSILYPLQDCKAGDILFRDYLEYIDKSDPKRKVLLYPWFWQDFTATSFHQTEPNEEYFLKGHLKETYVEDERTVDEVNPSQMFSRPIKVFTDYQVLAKHLNNNDHFLITKNSSEADIYWTMAHIYDYAELVQEEEGCRQFINQFPFEYVITIKDLLAIVCRRSMTNHRRESIADGKHPLDLDLYPDWLPITFNLETELEQFVSYFQNRAAAQLDNHWIIKPFNLARSINIHITNNLMEIVRLPSTGKKIAQKYVDKPVLFHRMDINCPVKFDVRYILLLKSTRKPTIEAYIDRKFYLRFCNRIFSLKYFDNYEKHFTVMNYRVQDRESLKVNEGKEKVKEEESREEKEKEGRGECREENTPTKEADNKDDNDDDDGDDDSDTDNDDSGNSDTDDDEDSDSDDDDDTDSDDDDDDDEDNEARDEAPKPEKAKLATDKPQEAKLSADKPESDESEEEELEEAPGSDCFMFHMKCEDFLKAWSEQYPDYPWSKIEDDICGMLYEMLECATKLPPPRGIGHCAQSRAMYAVDIILEWIQIPGSGAKKEDESSHPVPNAKWRIQPKLLEVNWSPDCKRACDYYPDFYNDIFDLLFLERNNNNTFRLLKK